MKKIAFHRIWHGLESLHTIVWIFDIVSSLALLGTWIAYFKAHLKLAFAITFNVLAVGTILGGAVLLRRQKARPQLRVVDVYPERSKDQIIEYKLKVRVAIQNEGKVTVIVNAVSWEAAEGEVPCQHPFKTSLQLEGEKGWKVGDWGPESGSVHVAPGKVFRLWIGIPQAFQEADIRQRHELDRIGTLVLSLDIAGVSITHRERI